MTMRPSTLWAGATVAAALVLAAALAPPFVPAASADALQAGFSWLCHQLPERTLHVHGQPVALCHRCLGMLAGLAAGLALAPLAPAAVRGWVDGRQQARVLLVAALPAVADWALGAAGWWTNTPASRALTGALFGLAAGAMIGLALWGRHRGAEAVGPAA